METKFLWVARENLRRREYKGIYTHNNPNDDDKNFQVPKELKLKYCYNIISNIK